MKSEKETIYDYAAELKLLAFKEELECTLSLAAEENWNHLQFLTELLGKESARRRECRRRSRIRSAYDVDTFTWLFGLSDLKRNTLYTLFYTFLSCLSILSV